MNVLMLWTHLGGTVSARRGGCNDCLFSTSQLVIHLHKGAPQTTVMGNKAQSGGSHDFGYKYTL